MERGDRIEEHPEAEAVDAVRFQAAGVLEHRGLAEWEVLWEAILEEQRGVHGVRGHGEILDDLKSGEQVRVDQADRALERGADIDVGVVVTKDVAKHTLYEVNQTIDDVLNKILQCRCREMGVDLDRI